MRRSLLTLAAPALVLGLAVYAPDDVIVGALALPCAILARLLGVLS